MIPRTILPALVALGICAMAVTHADAARTRVKARQAPAPTTIETVGTDSITIKDSSGEKTYKIVQDTEITYQGETVTLADLKAGMLVEVTPDPFNDLAAGLVQADDAPIAKTGNKKK